MQDGAQAHCTSEAKGFLVEKFRGIVISRETETEWPVYSADLNPVDFYLWALTQRQVYAAKPPTIAEYASCCQAVCV